jgi:5-methylthioadenosine/S-adenosylhomocysteine deaminase
MPPELTVYQGAYLLAGGVLRPQGRLAVDASGRVVSVGSSEDASSGAPQGPGRRMEERVFPSSLLVPGFVNSHSHAFQVLLRGRSERARSFRDWVDHHLYPLVERMTPELVYRSAVLSFGEMLLEGVTSVGEFFYLNRMPGAGLHGGAHAIVQAAEAVGIRLCLLRSLYDRKRRSAQDRFCEPLDEAIPRARELCAEIRARGHGFGIAPHSLHGASATMIREGFALGAELDCPVHIHVAEQRGDLEVARELYGTSPLRALEGLGVLDERLTCVHGVWLDEGEIELMARRGVHLAYNPRSNMALGDGIAPIREMLRAGVRVSLGIDGPGANNQTGILHEVRAAEALQRVRDLEMNRIPSVRIEEPSPAVLLEMATANGAKNLGLPTGELLPGQAADFLVVDLEDPSLWPWSEDEPETLLWNLLLSASPRACIRHVFVGGRPVVWDRRLVLVDLDKEIGGRQGLARQAAALV